MLLSFEITMPNVGSWNGVWTGAKNAHFAFRNYPKKEAERLMQGKEKRNFYYNFGDGWGANVCMMPISTADKKRIERSNSGFMGYDWMIDSIVKHDKIIAD
jgi:hypothetical protein